MADYKRDWEYDETDEVMSPKYNDGYKRYDLSMKDIIDNINKSKYPINGGNVMVPDGDGNLKPLPEVIGPGLDPAKRYRLEMLSSNGNIIKDRNFSTILSAMLFEDNDDITAKTDEKYFKWTRVSGTSETAQKEDAEWNLRWATGAKEVPITCEDVNRNAMFQVQFMTDVEEVLWVVDAYNNYKNLNNI